MYATFHVSSRGAAHQERGRHCQDAAFSLTFGDNSGLAIVADGHGGERHFRSETGADLAVKEAHRMIKWFLDDLAKEAQEKTPLADERRRDEQLRQLERTIITKWRKAALDDFTQRPLTEREKTLCDGLGLDREDENARLSAYGTTLIAALVRSDFWFVIQIGDGCCVVIDETGTPSFPRELDDERLDGGVTTSLCDPDAAGEFRRAFGFTPLRGLTVATDGVTDSFGVTPFHKPESYLKLHTTLLADFARDEEKAREELRKSIAIWSEKGSRDDVSMAGIFSKE